MICILYQVIDGVNLPSPRVEVRVNTPSERRHCFSMRSFGIFRRKGEL